MTLVRERTAWEMSAEQRKVPVITKIPIRIIFQPWRINVFIWSLMDIPA